MAVVPGGHHQIGWALTQHLVGDPVPSKPRVLRLRVHHCLHGRTHRWIRTSHHRQLANNDAAHPIRGRWPRSRRSSPTRGAGPRAIGTERFTAVSSGASFTQVAGAILQKQGRVQNPDRDVLLAQGLEGAIEGNGGSIRLRLASYSCPVAERSWSLPEVTSATAAYGVCRGALSLARSWR